MKISLAILSLIALGTSSISLAQAALPTFTAADVAKHSQESDCWFIIDTNVYNVTEWIPQHPGGRFIKRYCGKDATADFRARHAGSVDDTLNRFIIGTLAQ